MKKEEKTLSAIERTEDFGSAGSRRLLRAGRIPAVIYGKNKPVHVTLDAAEFNKKFRHFTETTLLELKVADKEYEVLMKDYQDDLLKDQIKHVDFYEVTRGQKLRTDVRIVLTGNPQGVRDGGVLDQVMHSVLIEALPKDLPDELVMDVSDMALNTVRHLSDLKLPQGVSLLDDPDKTVASCRTVREEAVATPEATAETEEAAAAGTAAPAAAEAPAADAKADEKTDEKEKK